MRKKMRFSVGHCGSKKRTETHTNKKKTTTHEIAHKRAILHRCAQYPGLLYPR